MTETTPTPKRVYCTGDEPVSPIIKGDRVYLISDVRKEEATEHEGLSAPALDNYSYVVDEELTPTDYFARVKEQQEATNWEQDAAIFELAALIAGGA